MNQRAPNALGAAIRAELRQQHLLPVILAAGGTLLAAPALALELGEARVLSTLGQPLTAAIPYSLGPNEQLESGCVSVRGGASASGLPAVSAGDVSVADGVITVAGRGVAREPLLSLSLSIRCPYTPQLTREYMLFVDPAMPGTSAAVAPPAPATPASATRAAPLPAVRRPAAERPAPAAGTRYRVQPGDSLSRIAERIENRSVGLWDAVGMIFEANPDAFLDGDPNRLKAGSWLTIPDLVTAGRAAATVFPTAAEPTPLPGETGTAGEPGATVAMQAQDTRPAATAVSPAAVSASDTSTRVATSTVTDTATDVAPGSPTDAATDAGADVAAPLPAPATEPAAAAAPSAGDAAGAVSIPDTALDGPQTRATAPNVPAASVVQARVEEPASGGLVGWLLGGVVALIGGLLLLSRRVRDTFGSTPIAPAQAPQRRRTDSGTRATEAVGKAEVDFSAPLEDDSPTHENPVLDADLVMGTGLTEGADVDVAHDFGFAATTQIDIELPEEMSSGGTAELPATDMIPPLGREMESILESEILPGEDDDDYDMSVIMDATKMPRPEDVTERDLAAIEIEDEPAGDGDYTLNQETDFEILEQDYEDELTATQALNKEIARAAAELAESLDDTLGDAGPDDKTAEMPLASVTAIDDATARLGRDEPGTLSDLDDTGVNEAITARLQADDKTVEMPSGEDGDTDITTEMPAKRGNRSR